MAANSAWPMSFHIQNPNWTYAQKAAARQVPQSKQQQQQAAAAAARHVPQSKPQTMAPRHTTARLVQLNQPQNLMNPTSMNAAQSLRYTTTAAYPYANYTTSLQQQSAAAAAAAATRAAFKPPSYAPNASIPYAAQSRTATQSQAAAAAAAAAARTPSQYVYGAQSQSRGPASLGRRVQNNVMSAASQYYGVPNGNVSAGAPSPVGKSSAYGSLAGGGHRGTRIRDRFGGNGYTEYGGASTAYATPKPSYSSSRPSPAYRGGYSASMASRGGYSSRRASRARGGRAGYQTRGRGRGRGRGRVVDADRDVLCWMFENQGRCRYNEKCQWLHLDPESGQYVPTMYIMNSLESPTSAYEPPHGSNKFAKAKTRPEQDDDDSKAEEKDDESHVAETQAMAEKFKALMAKTIEKNLATQSNDNSKEDNKEDSKEEEPSPKSEAHNDKKKTEASEETTKKYGAYKTTSDKFRVCWEFNMLAGCRNGDACKWSHEYLESITQHPYTGEKLNGLAVKKFRQTNNI